MGCIPSPEDAFCLPIRKRLTVDVYEAGSARAPRVPVKSLHRLAGLELEKVRSRSFEGDCETAASVQADGGQEHVDDADVGSWRVAERAGGIADSTVARGREPSQSRRRLPAARLYAKAGRSSARLYWARAIPVDVDLDSSKAMIFR